MLLVCACSINDNIIYCPWAFQEHWATGHPEYLRQDYPRPSNNDRTDEKVTHGCK